MKIIIPSINTQDVQALLSQISASLHYEEDILMEYFDVKESSSLMWNIETIPQDFQKLFYKLNKLVDVNRLESQGYYLTLVDKNEECFIVLHKIHPKQKHVLESVITIEFHLFEWANIEDLLLEHGFQVVCTIEEKRTSYISKKLQVEFIIVSPPFTPAYMEVKAKKREHMILALNAIGYSLDQTIITEN